MGRYSASFPVYFSDFFPESLEVASLVELLHMSNSQTQGTTDLRLNTIHGKHRFLVTLKIASAEIDEASVTADLAGQ